MKKIVLITITVLFPFCLSAQKKLINKAIDIYLCIGQSNMAGWSPILALDEGPFANTLLLNGKDEWEVAVCDSQGLNKYATVTNNQPSQKMGVSFGFAKKIENETDHYIGIIANARGGTSIEWWQKGYQGDKDFDMYEEAVRRTKAALAANPRGRLKAILWHQGESDNSSPKKDLYMARLKKLVSDLRMDLDAPDVPFVAGEVGKWKNRGLGVNPVIRQISDSIPNAYWVTADGLTSMNLTKNNPHFDTFSMRALGGRYADKIMEVVYKKPAGGVTFYNEAEFKGRSVMLKAGKYSAAWLEKIGIKPEEIVSVKLDGRYKVSFLTKGKNVYKLSESENDFKNNSFDTIEIVYQ